MFRITDLMNQKKFSYSFEVTPDISAEEIINLKVEPAPAFFSVTWHAKSYKFEDLDIPPLRMAKFLRSKEKHVMQHLSCDKLRKEYLDKVLLMLQENNICNLFVILGEKYDASTSDFNSTRELIAYIRASTGNYFCIAVAAFPDQSGNKLQHVKEKIDSGADCILTQAFFEIDVFTNFVKNCKENGVSVPIIPGVFLFENIKQLIGIINLCKVKVSQELLEKVRNKEVSDIPGREIVKKLVLDVKAQTEFKHFHFFTLNKLDFAELVKELTNSDE